MVTAFYSPPQEVDEENRSKREGQSGGGGEVAERGVFPSFLSYKSDDFIDGFGRVRAKSKDRSQAVVAWV